MVRAQDAESLAKKCAVPVDAGNGEVLRIVETILSFGRQQALQKGFSPRARQEEGVFGRLPMSVHSQFRGDRLDLVLQLRQALLDPRAWPQQDDFTHFKLDLPPPERYYPAFVPEAFSAGRDQDWPDQDAPGKLGVGLVADGRRKK